jgi:LAS superfamily LD-carboxypeptidase LdcB
MINGLAFRWLVANAYRHGFVNYAFEPWHWEWTGEAP